MISIFLPHDNTFGVIDRFGFSQEELSTIGALSAFLLMLRLIQSAEHRPGFGLPAKKSAWNGRPVGNCYSMLVRNEYEKELAS